MSKESIKMTPGDDTHLTLLMAPVSLNLVTGQDREHLLAYGRAAFEAGQKCQGCDVPKDGVYQISEPMPADKRALMLSVTASEPFKSQLKECAARIAELEAQLAAAQQGVHPENIREGAPYDNPEFEQLARDMGVWGTAQSAVCAQFWLAATQPAAQGMDAIRALIAQHGKELERNHYAYFELAYTRRTGWMVWITDKPAFRESVLVNPDRKVLARGQGDTPEAACADALAAQAKQGGAAND